MTEPFAQLTAFARELRDAGVPSGAAELQDFVTATRLLGPADVYWAGRMTLLTNADQIPLYDAAFARYWTDAVSDDRPAPPPPPVDRDEPGAEGMRSARGNERGREALEPSALELLRHKSFGEIDDAELQMIAERLRALIEELPARRTLRSRPGGHGELDLRRTAARALRHGGDSHELIRRRPRVRPRPLVLLLDVSGSMTPYARALMILGHAAARAGRRCETFCFATRLTRTTGALRERDATDAIARAAEEVFDWDGGTRIGESLKAFLDLHGHAGMARGAVVVICSDGLEVGDPALLGAEMARLQRLASRVIWLNPLKAQANYEPLAQGMAAALPYTDTFSSGHSLAALEALMVP
ncbi:MAG TPA: VWA domain-containing protein [Thermoleophilaceae bacterium]|jgi:uncharacterized protein with von Willebrand factor type A (vWA) domain|nr:VWA domain-containing protein [Thermoleophilaceae bacterium]